MHALLRAGLRVRTGAGTGGRAADSMCGGACRRRHRLDHPSMFWAGVRRATPRRGPCAAAGSATLHRPLRTRYSHTGSKAAEGPRIYVAAPRCTRTSQKLLIPLRHCTVRAWRHWSVNSFAIFFFFYGAGHPRGPDTSPVTGRAPEEERFRVYLQPVTKLWSRWMFRHQLLN